MWEGLDNAAWGSHVYFETVSRFNQIRLAKGDSWLSKPITLTKFGMADWRPNMSAVIAQESPAQHRFPVWWTGDGVSLQASVESMVNSGVHDFKPYVHSDCGGDADCGLRRPCLDAGRGLRDDTHRRAGSGRAGARGSQHKGGGPWGAG